jgi:DNA ligase 1
MPDLQDGETVEIKGSARNPYQLKNVGGVYSCTCPAWRNQSLAIEQRTCKHLRKYRGEQAEADRIGGALPTRPAGSPAAKATAPPLLLAHSWANDIDLDGWWISEKLDGVRAYWDGERFLSRLGNPLHAPEWFVAGLPKTPLDGELWLDRKAFQRTISIVRRQDKSDHWREIAFVMFDAPLAAGDFEARQAYLREVLEEHQPPHARVLDQQRCRGLAHLEQELARVEALGGEGLMLRQPSSAYEAGRSTTLLKVKTFHDAEAQVVDHVAGRGRHKGRLGALAVELPDGTRFSVGTGLSDAQRENPPPVGSTITFRYQELSDGGVPRFPSFVRLTEAGKAAGAPPAAAKPSAKTPSAKTTDQPAHAARYFEFDDGKSQKFWEITHSATEVTVRYGRLGTAGQTKTKAFADAAAAARHCEKLIAEKTGKGYAEITPP